MASSGLALGDEISWASIPTRALLDELSKRDDAVRKPQCGSREQGSYNTGLHVFALFLILAVSTVACALPNISRRPGGSRKPGNVIFYCQHFGTGVLIATAFVHLLPTAFTSLTDPCLPEFFNIGYKPLAGLISMVFALAVVALESYLSTRGAGHAHSHEAWDGSESGGETAAHERAGLPARARSFAARRGSIRRPSNIAMDDLAASESLIAGASPLPESSPAPTTKPNRNGASRGGPGGPVDEEYDGDEEPEPMRASSDDLDPSPVKAGPVESPLHMPTLDEQKRMATQVVLLEAGILFHSVFIGMALSVATGPSFLVFLIAICFHQFFEGVALGSRIAGLHFPRKSVKPWVMVLAFGLTTPIGQSIGLGIHNFYDPLSQTGLLMVGIMNAISSGLLLFAGLVQLLAEDFLTEKSYQTLHGWRRMQAFVAVVSGASLMALVGAFA